MTFATGAVHCGPVVKFAASCTEKVLLIQGYFNPQKVEGGKRSRIKKMAVVSDKEDQ